MALKKTLRDRFDIAPKAEKSEKPKQEILHINQLSETEMRSLEKEFEDRFYKSFDFMSLYIPPEPQEAGLMKYLPVGLGLANVMLVAYLAFSK